MLVLYLKTLAELGINVFYHTVVGDNLGRLKEAIKIAEKRSNLIIFYWWSWANKR